ncbi:hypothetical protein EVAR_30937_1 [Eumeta japonica]|uniref:Uncharacterized protein n=1 Tax=Eumeta variegata TaxID=151549 RepID=A0A4C1V4Z6_EUMVA|nr:hypothetical protein EVAR_30937_1 [Eumeta japonica]
MHDLKAKCNAKRNASRPTLFCEKENRLKAILLVAVIHIFYLLVRTHPSHWRNGERATSGTTERGDRHAEDKRHSRGTPPASESSPTDDGDGCTGTGKRSLRRRHGQRVQQRRAAVRSRLAGGIIPSNKNDGTIPQELYGWCAELLHSPKQNDLLAEADQQDASSEEEARGCARRRDKLVAVLALVHFAQASPLRASNKHL